MNSDALHNAITVLYVLHANRALWVLLNRHCGPVSLMFLWSITGVTVQTATDLESEQAQLSTLLSIKPPSTNTDLKESEHTSPPTILQLLLEVFTLPSLFHLSDPKQRVKPAPVSQTNPPQCWNLSFPWRLLLLQLPDLCFLQELNNKEIWGRVGGRGEEEIEMGESRGFHGQQGKHTHSHTQCYTCSPHTKFMSGIYCFLGLAELKDCFIDLFVCTFEAFSIIKMSSKAVRGEASALKCQKMWKWLIPTEIIHQFYQVPAFRWSHIGPLCI